MRNERLRSALLEKGMTPVQLAEAVGVDPKTIERWIAGRTPYRNHRYKVATVINVDEAYLWPEALSRNQIASASENEIITVYPHRWVVPSDFWRAFFENAEHEIGILVYSGLFLAEDVGIVRTIRRKAEAGATVRILLGDPTSEEVAKRGADEDIGETMAARIRNTVVLLRPLRNVGRIEFRTHRTILYNSIYRADDQLMVNTHIYSCPASQAPVFHLRRVAGGDMVTTYLESFDNVWDNASPLE